MYIASTTYYMSLSKYDNYCANIEVTLYYMETSTQAVYYRTLQYSMYVCSQYTGFPFPCAIQLHVAFEALLLLPSNQPPSHHQHRILTKSQ